MTQFRQSIRLILAALIAFGWSYYYPAQENYWMIISALFALHISNHFLVRHKDFFLLVIALTAGSLAAISSLISSNVFLLATYLFITTLGTVYVGLLWPAFWGATFLVNFYANLSSGFGTDMRETGYRFLSIFAGFIIAILLQTIFFPNRLKGDCKLVLTASIQKLLELNQAIFDCYLAADYSEKRFQYERKLHQKRRDYSYEISVARQLIKRIKATEREPLNNVMCALEQIYEIMLSMGLLDYRVEDRSTFELAYKELLEISENINSELRAIKIQLLKKKPPSVISEKIKESIYQLEDVSRVTLDVAAKDPMVFLLFVQDLYALNKMMEQLTQDVAVLSGGKSHG